MENPLIRKISQLLTWQLSQRRSSRLLYRNPTDGKPVGDSKLVVDAAKVLTNWDMVNNQPVVVVGKKRKKAGFDTGFQSERFWRQ